MCSDASVTAFQSTRKPQAFDPPKTRPNSLPSTPATISVYHPSATNMSHRAQHGFALCNHTCQPSQCENKRRSCNLFAKEGSAAKRHSSNGKLHRGCRAPCPVAAGMKYTRNATEDDHAVAIREMALAGVSSKKIDEFFSKQIPEWNAGLVNWRLLVTQR